MLIALQDREKFLKNALTPMSFFGVKTAMLYVFRNPVEYNVEKGWEFPNTIYLVARQDGEVFQSGEYRLVEQIPLCTWPCSSSISIRGRASAAAPG